MNKIFKEGKTTVVIIAIIMLFGLGLFYSYSKIADNKISDNPNLSQKMMINEQLAKLAELRNKNSDALLTEEQKKIQLNELKSLREQSQN